MAEEESCNDTAAQNTVLSAILTLGVLGNTLLITGILRFRHRNWQPDKILILNLAFVDLLACVTSLPAHLTVINTNPSSDGICLARYLLMFSFFAINIMTLAVISIDRYDAVCVLPRKITCRRTVYMLVFIWLFGTLSTLAGGMGFITALANNRRLCLAPGIPIAKEVATYKAAMIGVVAIWITPSLAVIINRFTSIMKFLRRRSEDARANIVTARAASEIKLFKVCMILVVTYLSLWLMFAIMVLLRNRMHSKAVHCTYLWAYTLAYASYSVIPIEYMLLDRRVGLRAFRRVGPRPSGRHSTITESKTQSRVMNVQEISENSS